MIERRRFLISAAGAAASLGFRDLPEVADAAPASQLALGALAFAAHRLDPAARGADTPLAYGSAAPGQVLRIKPGTDVPVTLKNAVGEATDLDWHGMRVAAALEIIPGVSGAPVPPGGEVKLMLRSPDSGTCWVHPSYVPGWSNQTTRGLAAVLVVEEPDAPSVDADLVLFLGDRLGSSGTTPADTLQVNAKAWPQTTTARPGSRLRLRIVNGSTRQALSAAFVGAEPFVVAIDGQPSDLFRPLNDMLPLGPGTRFDVMVDLPGKAGETFSVLLRGPEMAPSTPSPTAFIARTDGTPVSERPPIHSLTPNPALPPIIHLEHATRIDIAAAMGPADTPGHLPTWTLNGASGIKPAAKPLFAVKRNTPVTLGFTNKGPHLAAFRLHGHVMRLLHSKDDGWEPYWRDSILVAPGVTFHAAFLADNPGRWLIDSPFFDQAAGGFRTWFEVT
ncbi:MAG TPA: multicopper oxidase family protein [Lichenihabitans sp.]|jgi:FtsP/CotA-like multicopper oxidase with cupredoxin domain|nr:multicopper oxidase family protein [Lichenihabitans sp.]